MSEYLELQFLNKNEVDVFVEPTRVCPFAASQVFKAPVSNCNLLTRGESVKRVYDVTIDLKDINYSYEPGDTIAIYPNNDIEEINALFKRLQVAHLAKKLYNLSILKETTKKNPSIPKHIPKQCTLLELFLKFLDIHSIPKKTFLQVLTRYCTNIEDLQRLNLISSKTSKEYISFIIKNNTLLKILQCFPSCNPPIERLLEYLPPLQPRPYSISSSPCNIDEKQELHITFVVVDKDDVKGTCSGWLERNLTGRFKNKLEIDANSIESDLDAIHIDCKLIDFYFRNLIKFRLPKDLSKPIIMIGCGTGIAPFYGFLQHRLNLFKKISENFGESWLFYGCRFSNCDFLYKKEIYKFLENGILSKLFTCFSRESFPKMYIQDIIEKNGEALINKIVDEEAYTYVCGDLKNMCKEVNATIVSCLIKYKNFTNSETQIYMKTLEASNRYIQDSWI